MVLSDQSVRNCLNWLLNTKEVRYYPSFDVELTDEIRLYDEVHYVLHLQKEWNPIRCNQFSLISENQVNIG